jgi:signal transduction histidine kinase
VKKREPNREFIDLGQTVGDVLAFIKRDARFNCVDVRVELPGAPITVFGDSVQIEQVLLNLARNAIDSMVESTREEKVLTIKVAPAGQNGVEFSVRDTGVGIPPSMLARVCEPFVSSKSDGLGMGLSICRTIVDAHNGSLEITSDQAWGTLVRVILPNSNDGVNGI